MFNYTSRKDRQVETNRRAHIIDETSELSHAELATIAGGGGGEQQGSDPE